MSTWLSSRLKSFWSPSLAQLLLVRRLMPLGRNMLNTWGRGWGGGEEGGGRGQGGEEKGGASVSGVSAGLEAVCTGEKDARCFEGLGGAVRAYEDGSL